MLRWTIDWRTLVSPAEGPSAARPVTIGKGDSYPREAREVASCRMYIFAQ